MVNSFADVASRGSPALGGVGVAHGQIDPFSLFNQIYPGEDGGGDETAAALMPTHGNLQPNLTKSESSDRLATMCKN